MTLLKPSIKMRSKAFKIKLLQPQGIIYNF